MSNQQNNSEVYYYEEKKFTAVTSNSTEDLINSLNFDACPANIIDHEVQDGEKQWPWGYIAQISEPEQLQQIQNQDEIFQEFPQQIIQIQQKVSLLSNENQKQNKKKEESKIIQEVEDSKTEIKQDKKISKKWMKKMDKILKGKQIKYEDHNRNMPPFFVRIFSKYFDEFKDEFQSKEGFLQQTYQKLQQIQQKKKANLKELISLLGSDDSKIHRRIMQKIIRQKSKGQIIMSRNIDNKISYLLCSKIYTLRCKSKHLIGRVQSK